MELVRNAHFIYYENESPPTHTHLVCVFLQIVMGLDNLGQPKCFTAAGDCDDIDHPRDGGRLAGVLRLARLAVGPQQLGRPALVVVHGSRGGVPLLRVEGVQKVLRGIQ